MPIRGVRGAIQVEENSVEAIADATRTLIAALFEANPNLEPADLASVFFTLTEDLQATYPAFAARDLPGWESVPLLCSQEIPVPTSLARCLRILMHWNTELSQAEISHVYLGAAASLRPDLTVSRS
jgi:chorismate mutase